MKGSMTKQTSRETNDRVPLGFGDLFATAGDHIGHFYRTKEEGLAVRLAFLKTGLQVRDKCVCLIGSGYTRQEMDEALKADGIDVDAAIASGQLVINEGKRHPQELKDMLSQTLAEIPTKFSLLRWIGVMSWAFEKIPTTEKLMEWETHCNIVEEPEAVFLCQYELPAFLGTVVMDAMRTHPICIVENIIHQNPYYQEPRAYLAEIRNRKSTELLQ